MIDNQKKILITGAAGFIGFHLVKRLASTGLYNITGVDNINSYYDVNLKYGRLKALGIDTPGEKSSIYENFTFVKEDISDYEGMRKIFEEGKFDIVCNLAAQAGVRYSFENPFTYINSNVNGFMYMQVPAVYTAITRRYLLKRQTVQTIRKAYMLQAKRPMNLWLTYTAARWVFLLQV